jgi:hypothetical protein
MKISEGYWPGYSDRPGVLVLDGSDPTAQDAV